MPGSRTLALLMALCSALLPKARAVVTITLPDTSQTSTATSTVSEQANFSVPSSIGFSVNDIGSATSTSGLSVSATGIILLDSAHRVVVSVRADASSFTPPVSGAVTWNASDVTWNAATWTNGSGTSGTLSSAAFNNVGTSNLDPGSFSTTGLVFTLAANSALQYAGNYTLSLTWKIQSM